MDFIFEVYPLFYDRDDVRTCLYQTAKQLFVANLRTALIAVGWLLLVARLLAILARDIGVTDQIIQLYMPSAISDLRFVEAPLHAATWLIVTTGSFACICLQAQLLWRTRWVIMRSWTRLCWLEFVVLLVAGLLSAGTFSFIVTKASGSVDQLEMGTTLKTPFYLTAVIRSTQSVFSALCTAIIMPMSRRWADRLDNEQKKYLTNLLSWRILLCFHWNILLPTFCRRAIVTEAGLAVTHAASTVYRNVVIIWLFLLVAYINKTPRYYPSQEEQATPGNNVEMTKLTCTAPVYPKQSELVTTVNCISPSPQLGELVMPMLRGMKLSPI